MYKEINPLYSFLSVQFCGVMYIHDVVLLSAQSSHINSSKLKLDPLNMNSYFLPPPNPWQPPFYCAWELDYSRYLVQVNNTIICSFVTDLCHWA